MRDYIRAAAVAASLSVAACASAPSQPVARATEGQSNDPLETSNRAVFGANQYVDRNALRPVAKAYRDNLPAGVRRSVRNFVTNLNEPRVLINDVLQGNTSRAWNTTQRFAVNTTAGGLGLFDVATGWGLPYHQADFGQTFGVWGVGPGPDVQLPLFGASNARDTVGTAVNFVANPLTYVTGGLGSALGTANTVGIGAGVVDGRAQLVDTTDALEAGSLDYYATLRSINAQRRAAFVEEGRIGAVRARSAAPARAPSAAPETKAPMNPAD